MDDGAAGEAVGLGPLPGGRLVQRNVDLHFGATVAKPRRRGGDVGRHRVLAQERPVQLGRRHGGNDRTRRGDDVAVGESHAGCPAVGDENPLDSCLHPNLAAGVEDDPGERVDERDAAADGHGHPAELQRGADHLGHEARRRLIRAEAGVQHPGSEDTARRL